MEESVPLSESGTQEAIFPAEKPFTAEKSGALIIKILCVMFLVVVIILTIFVFLNRSKLQSIGNYGLIGVFALCFISNATVFLPAPSLAVVAAASSFIHPVMVSVAGAFGTTLGELTGFFSGKAGKRLRGKENSRLGNAVKKHGITAVFVFALLPLPLFDIIGVVSGYSGVKLLKFIAACLPGKLIKMLIYAFGSAEILNILNSMTIK